MHMLIQFPPLIKGEPQSQNLEALTNRLRRSSWFPIFKQLACTETQCPGTKNYLCPCRFSMTDYSPHDNRKLQKKQFEKFWLKFSSIINSIIKIAVMEVLFQQLKKITGLCMQTTTTNTKTSQPIPQTLLPCSFSKIDQFCLIVYSWIPLDCFT